MNIFTSIELFSKQRVLIIGEAILDSYLYGITKRFCREAPVPLVDVKETKNVAGGAANTAVNTAALGGQVTFLSVIGDDVEGEKVLAYLSKFDVQTAYVVKDATRQTLTKKRILADGQVLLRFDLGSTHAISKGQENLLIASLRMVYPSI